MLTLTAMSPKAQLHRDLTLRVRKAPTQRTGIRKAALSSMAAVSTAKQTHETRRIKGTESGVHGGASEGLRSPWNRLPDAECKPAHLSAAQTPKVKDCQQLRQEGWGEEAWK